VELGFPRRRRTSFYRLQRAAARILTRPSIGRSTASSFPRSRGWRRPPPYGSHSSVGYRIGIQTQVLLGWLAGLAKRGYGLVRSSLYFFLCLILFFFFHLFSICCFEFQLDFDNLFCRFCFRSFTGANIWYQLYFKHSVRSTYMCMCTWNYLFSTRILIRL
jgi:hypothetical protein